MFCTSCSGPVEETEVSILYITDAHGLLLPNNFTGGDDSNSTMANFSTYINYVHNTRGKDHTVLLCGGDLNDALPALYYYNSIARFEDHISPLVMNYLDFDAIQLGASDMAMGMDAWIGILPAQYKMPYMCGNLLDNKTQMCPFPPYTIVERAGVRIAVIGLLDANDCAWLGPEDIQGLHLGDIVQGCHNWVKYIREYEKPDYVIVMASAGTHNKKLLGTPGVDLFLMGSDHRALPVNDYRLNDDGDSVLVVQPMPRLTECARVDLRVRKQGKKVVGCSADVQRVPLSSLDPDTAFVHKFAPQVEAVDKYLCTTIGTLTTPLCYSDALFGPSAWMDLKHEMQMWSTGADISITNIGSEVGDIPSGDITMKDLFHYFNSDYKLWVVPMTGAEVKSFLEAAVAVQYNQMKSASDHILAFRLNEINEVMIGTYGPELVQQQDKYCSAAGINYTVDVTQPVGRRVNITTLTDGTPFREMDSYRVAMPDYLAIGGGRYAASLGWNQQSALRRLDFHGTLSLRTHFINFVRARKSITPKVNNNWRVIPKDFYETGMKRDLQLMKRYVR